MSIIDPNSALNRFEGYSDASATQKKVMFDVFIRGDVYFNSGDLLRRDWFGFFYWCDRVGDTFRFKGENVATTGRLTALRYIIIISNILFYL